MTETRRGMPVRVYRLGHEPGDDLSSVTTPDERLAIVRALTARAWMLTSKPVPSYDRRAMPVVVVRPR